MLRRSMEQIYYDTEKDMEQIKTVEELAAEAFKQVQDAERIEQVQIAEDTNKQEEDIQKVYIRNYGNLMLDIMSSNDIGLSARSIKRNEKLFIPWTSIVMVTKEENESRE